MKKINSIVISRTDNLGDVILTLPLAGFLKQTIPDVKISFVGKSYTRPLIENSKFIDVFLDKEEILQEGFPNIPDAIVFIFPDKDLSKKAKQAKIPIRIGTSHRLFHWLYCNQLVNFSRKKSDLHESQLNFKLLKPLKLSTKPKTSDMPNWYGLEAPPLSQEFQELLSPNHFKLIIHPKSKGSAREWSMENYLELAQSLSPEQFQIFITGTEAEGKLIHQEKSEIFDLTHVQDLTGKMTLSELVAFIGQVDGLLACSTGPLHIASALGKFALGLYPSIRPMHPGRWKPVGKRAEYLTLKENCSDCKGMLTCACILGISPHVVKNEILKMYHHQFNNQ